jgi:hypothetical protein
MAFGARKANDTDSAAVAGSDSPLLAQSVVETGANDVPWVLAVVLGGLWLAPATATERRWDRNPVSVRGDCADVAAR